jgi:hypothetical protein
MKQLVEVLASAEVTERREKDYAVLRFPFLEVDKATANRRLYPREVMRRAISEAQPLINKGSLFGSSAHRTSMELDDVSHVIQKLSLEGSLAICEAKVLPTTKGKNLQVILKHGRLGVSARGVGTVKVEKEVEVVQPDYRLLGLDFVVGPASGMYVGAEHLTEQVGASQLYPSAGILTEDQVLAAKFYLAQKAGYRGDWETFRVLEENKDKIDLFHFAVRSGYKGTFSDFIKGRRK